MQILIPLASVYNSKKTKKRDRQMQVCTHLSRFALVSRSFPGRYAKKYPSYCIIAWVLTWQREKDSTSAAAEARSRLWSAPGTPFTTAPVRILAGNQNKRTATKTVLLFWQREKDSNPHIRSQSPLCYLYTIPLNARAIILKKRCLSRDYFA